MSKSQNTILFEILNPKEYEAIGKNNNPLIFSFGGEPKREVKDFYIYQKDNGSLAQRSEQRTHNPLVLGSNPRGPTTSENDMNKELNDAMNELGKLMRESADLYEKETNDWWEKLSYDDKIRAFYSVVKRIHKGDVEERRSYRGVLYDTFEFGMDSYGIGMECGYLDVHNYIFTGIEAEEQEIKEASKPPKKPAKKQKVNKRKGKHNEAK